MTDKMYEGLTKDEIQNNSKYTLKPPQGAAMKNYCNSCGLTWYSSMASEFTSCIRCAELNSVGSTNVINGS